jgi:hypothetical protein
MLGETSTMTVVFAGNLTVSPSLGLLMEKLGHPEMRVATATAIVSIDTSRRRIALLQLLECGGLLFPASNLRAYQVYAVLIHG